jgi:cytochrome c553
MAAAALIVAGVASGCGGGGNGAVETTTAATTTEVCHGPMGAGGHVGPNLQKSPVAEHLAEVEEQVRKGGGAMPPFAGVLSDQEIAAVARYVVGEIAPKA